MDARTRRLLARATGASAVVDTEVIQRLWSDYGAIVRCTLAYGAPAQPKSVIVKHVRWPAAGDHPRGWNTDRSHARKVRSYEVESAWYESWAARCGPPCRVPSCHAVARDGDEVLLVLEDLDAAGFDERRTRLSMAELDACLKWLAHFHATFMGVVPDGLWETGTYWHLATRPDELARLDDPALKAAAPAIDRRLSGSAFQTLVHGDAKLANFCFASDGRVAAVDFQYVGGGCGMKDVAYFFSSCLSEDECERQEAELLDRYFSALRAALSARGAAIDGAALEADWRALYPVAWTDFVRFLKGWSPGHWKVHRYSQRLADAVVGRL
ncbi:MAG: phosphotransferase [Pseudomonadota bacterium]